LPGSEWEDVFCPLCPAGTKTSPYLTCGDRFHSPEFHNYAIVCCSRCGLRFLSPRPAPDLAPSHHKQDGYDPFISFSSPRSLLDRIYLASRKFTLAWKRRLVRRILPEGGRVLDIGCGTGEFLQKISDFCQVDGVEPEPAAANWGRERLGLNIHTGFLEDVELPAGNFDLVTMWHALEHIPDPVSALNRIHSLLKPGGILLVAVPNINSYDAKRYGSEWIALDAPRHLWHFSPSTLRQITSLAQFTHLRGGALPLDTFYNTLMSEQLKQRTGSGNLVVAPFRMGWVIAGSLLKGQFFGEPSGMFHQFKK